MIAPTSCPKCERRRDAAWDECPFCGVVYAKAERPGAGSAALPPLPAALAGGAAATLPPPWPGGGVDPYRPPTAPIAFSSAEPGLAGDLAGRGARLLASVVDTVVLVVLALPFMIPWFGGLDTLTADLASRAGDAAALSDGIRDSFFRAMIAPLLLYALLQGYLLYRSGQTVGKKVTGVRIVRVGGERAGIVRIGVLRVMIPQALAAVPLVGTVFGLVNVLFIFRADRRCLHDHLAGTQVVAA